MENQEQNENLISGSVIAEQASATQNMIPEKQKKKLWKKILIWFFAVLFVLIILFYSSPHILGLFYKDISSVNDSDLRIVPEVVADSDNAYFDYLKLSGKVISSVGGKDVDTFLAGTDWNQNFVDTILTQNQTAIQIFENSSQKTKYQDPAFSNVDNLTAAAVTFPLGDVRKISKIMSIKSTDLSRKGNLLEALTNAFEITDTGQKIENSYGDLIGVLSGSAIKQIGLERIQRLIKSPSLSPDQIYVYQSKLESYKDNKEKIASAFKFEYIRQTNTIGNSLGNALKEAKMSSANLRASFYYQPNKTRQLLAESMRKNILFSSETCDQLKEVNTPEPEKLSAAKLYFTPNAIGVILSRVISVTMTSPYLKDCEQDKLITDLQSELAK